MSRTRSLDGLRALAVGGVFAYHLNWTGLPGGFLGVDLFFTLSGFLIAGLLIDEFGREKRINLAKFFARRTRRLFPALALVLLACCLWAYRIANSSEIGDLRAAAISGIFFVANWRAIFADTSYFAALDDSQLLSHLWSLAIEEQFYLFFPLLLLVLMRNSIRSRWLAVIGFSFMLSIIFMALSFDSVNPSLTYLNTFARVHQLLIGVALALVIRFHPNLSSVINRVSWMGLPIILLMMMFVSEDEKFYFYGGAAILSAATTLLIHRLVANPATSLSSRTLSLSPLVWLGTISYGIYLWHIPVIVLFNPARANLQGLPLSAIQIAFTISLAASSYYLVEKPIREGKLGRFVLTDRRTLISTPLLAVALSGVVIISTTSANAAFRPVSENVVPPKALLGSKSPEAPILMVAGDSVPKLLMAQIAEQAQVRGWKVVPLAFGGCGITGIKQVDLDGKSFGRGCFKGLKELQSLVVEKYDPDVVLWFSTRDRFPISHQGDIYPANSQTYFQIQSSAVEDAFQRFTAGGAKLKIVLPIPRAPVTISRCAVAATASKNCAIDEPYYASLAQLRLIYRNLQVRHGQEVSLYDFNDLLCPGGRDCPNLEISGEPIRSDGIHFSEAGGRWFTPILFHRLKLDEWSATP